ncbi:MAG: CMP-2-keto-3-deoxyoctulosonic acid synthetase, partial [Gammaproteobacteria bacterium]
LLEEAEQLEQLRALENGMTVNVSIVSHGVPGINTAEDYEKFVNRWRSAQHNR